MHERVRDRYVSEPEYPEAVEVFLAGLRGIIKFKRDGRALSAHQQLVSLFLPEVTYMTSSHQPWTNRSSVMFHYWAFTAVYSRGNWGHHCGLVKLTFLRQGITGQADPMSCIEHGETGQRQDRISWRIFLVCVHFLSPFRVFKL